MEGDEDPGPYGSGMAGGGGNGIGAICDFTGFLYLTNCTIAANSGVGGFGGMGQGGLACGGIKVFGCSLINTLLANNLPGGNGSGGFADLGYNLSSDARCAFTDVGSMNSTDPKLSPLQDNGGPTLTMALLRGSPCIDAGDTAAAPPADQRGYPRPAGRAADIGAVEYGSVMPVVTIGALGAGSLEILVMGNAGQSCCLLQSSNLVDWEGVATNQIGANGLLPFQLTQDPRGACRLYRVAVP
jgi:hypothetical protein